MDPGRGPDPAFDKIGHSFLLDQLGVVPRQGHDRRVAEGGGVRGGQGIRAHGGRHSTGRRRSVPLLLNVALHGLEEAAGVRYRGRRPRRPRARTPRSWSGTPTTSWSAATPGGRPSRSQERLAGWLAPSGACPSTRTRPGIVHLTEGFDFLGWNFRRYPSGKLLIKPSKAAIRKHRQQARGGDAQAARLQRGGGHRHAQPRHPGLDGLSPGHGLQRGLQSLDDYMWKLTWSGHGARTRTSRSAGSRPVLRHVQPVQARHVGVRRPAEPAAPPAQALLDADPPPRHGQGQGIPRRPGPGRLLAVPPGRDKTPAGQHNLRLLTRQDGRCPLCGDRCSPPDHLPSPPRNGQLVAERVRRAIAADTRPPRRRGTPDETEPPDTRLLLPGAESPAAQEPGTATRNALGACLSRMPGNWHVRF